MLAKVLHKFKGSEFSRNTAAIFLSSLMSQLVLVGATPWLTRLYAPEAFGLYTVFIAIGSVAAYVMTLRYTQGIVVADTDHDAYTMLRACIKLSLGLGLTFLAIWTVFLATWLSAFKVQELGRSFLLLPVYAAVMGLNEAFTVWLNRNKAFRNIALNRVATSLITLTVTVLWGYFIDNSAQGLIAGVLVGFSIGTGLMAFRSRAFFGFERIPGAPTERELMKRYKSFALYTLPSDFINILTNQLPALLLNQFAVNGAAAAGHYGMSNRILGLPSTFVSNAIGEVFRQRAAEDYRTVGTCRPIFLKTFMVLAAIGIPVFAVVALAGPWLFPAVLGAEWKEAGQYSRILSLLFCLKFIVSPLTVTFYIAHKQRTDFYFHIVMAVFAALPFYIGFAVLHNTFAALLCYTLVYSAIYILYFYLSLSYATKSKVLQPV